jgi:hypothetical protein
MLEESTIKKVFLISNFLNLDLKVKFAHLIMHEGIKCNFGS